MLGELQEASSDVPFTSHLIFFINRESTCSCRRTKHQNKQNITALFLGGELSCCGSSYQQDIKERSEEEGVSYIANVGGIQLG
jgi:hypothetical protein